MPRSRGKMMRDRLHDLTLRRLHEYADETHAKREVTFCFMIVVTHSSQHTSAQGNLRFRLFFIYNYKAKYVNSFANI